MRLSESLHKNILEVKAGWILNKFKIRKRRVVLFFEDILAEYINECEKAGYEEEMKEIGQKWMNLVIQQLLPLFIKKLPATTILNNFLGRMWINLGLMNDLHTVQEDNIIRIETKNETNVKAIGKNQFAVGFYEGVLNILFQSQMKCINVIQTTEFCEYTFKIKNESFSVAAKEKTFYDQLNYLPRNKGFTLKDCLKSKIFYLKKNQVFFREKRLTPLENTLSHLFGNYNILLNKLPHTSFIFFKQIIDEAVSNQKKLTLLKTILQSTGWGIIKIVIKNENEILFKIKNPPYGLQIEKDNWIFLINIILGYLWLLDKNFTLTNFIEKNKKLNIEYST